MVAISCRLSQSSVGVPLHSMVVSISCMLGDPLLNTPSRLLFPQSPGAAYLVFWFVQGLCCCSLGGVVRLSFHLVVTFRSLIVCCIGTIPAIFRFVVFATGVTFESGTCFVVWTVMLMSLEALISSHLSTFGFEMAKLVAIEAVSFLSHLRIVFRWFGFWLSWFYFVERNEGYLIWCSKTVKAHFSFQVKHDVVIRLVFKVRPVKYFLNMVGNFGVYIFVNK